MVAAARFVGISLFRRAPGPAVYGTTLLQTFSGRLGAALSGVAGSSPGEVQTRDVTQSK